MTNTVNEGDRFGYYINEKKSWLILKSKARLKAANNLFTNTKINITTEGERHLGAVIGSNKLRIKYVTNKADKWINELRTLSTYAKLQL